jgi:4-amino-4-deoxy-L-arabinose transferase-like glycosyltransferase
VVREFMTFPPFDVGANGNEPLARVYVRTLALCVVLLTVLRLLALVFSRTELYFDEAQYWFWSQNLAFGYYSKPPLIAWIIRASTELCGMGEACIRAPAPIIHGATALLVAALGWTLYGARIGFWAGLVYATLPGVSFSSTLISTDVPLLFFVSLGLLAVAKLAQRRSWGWTLTLGAAIGLGFLSKYAMSYFLLALAFYAAFLGEKKPLWRGPHLYVALLIGVLLVVPNIVWNMQNSFATFAHTAENAAWGTSSFRIMKLFDFLSGQLGVFGPVLFVVLVIFVAKAARKISCLENSDDLIGTPERLLLVFTIPALVLMTGQAFVSRAHANWAAFAYIAATVLVTALMVRAKQGRLFRFSLGLHIVVGVLLMVGGAFAGRMALPLIRDPYARILGWKAVAEATAAKAEAGGFHVIATDKRALAAELFYYLRDRKLSIVALRNGPPHDHFELTRPLGDDTPRPILLASFTPPASSDTTNGRSNGLGAWTAPAGQTDVVVGGKRRAVYFYAIWGSAK